MKLTKLALAVAASLVASQSFAAAVTTGEINAARANSTLKELWVSGASAPTHAVYDAFARSCDADTLHIWTAATSAAAPGSIGNLSAYGCKRATVPQVMYHTVEGGSFNAYAPHMPNNIGNAPDGTALPAVLNRVKDVGTVTCSGSGSYTPVSVTFATTAIPVETGCTTGTAAALADSAPALPKAGVSDVEAALWGYNLAKIGSIANFGAEKDAGLLQGFGVAVTKGLYRAMQVKQGIFADVTTANTNDGSFLPANAPNITTAQYASIVANGGGYQTDWTVLAGDSTKTINLIRRVATSGTQAASDSFFLKTNCASGKAGGQMTAAVTADSAGLFNVEEKSGSSDVKNRLVALDGLGEFGIGVLSLENSTATTWKYLKLDGAHPETGDTSKARTGIATGAYTFAMEMKTFVPSTATAADKAFFTLITNNLGKPATAAKCSELPRGVVATKSGGSQCVAGTTKSVATKGGKNCAQPILF